MKRLSAIVGATLMAFSLHAAAETRIGVVDLRQALFSSNDAQVFSQKLQQDFAGEEAQVREAQEKARKLKDRLEKDGAMMNESERNKLASEFQETVQEFNFLKQRLTPRSPSVSSSSSRARARKSMKPLKSCWMNTIWI